MLRLLLGSLLGLLFAAPVALAQDGYRIQPGDTLRIEVIEDASLNREALVLPDGRVSMPLAGTVRAAGLTVTEVSRAIAGAIAPNFATQPTVSVAVTALDPPLPPGPEPAAPTIGIYILGEIGAPGRKDLPPGTTFLQALSEAGGFTNFAADKRIQLRRRDPATGQEYVYPINYRALSRGVPITGNPTLYDGDVILVPERGLFE